MSLWFRYYTDTLDSPKVQDLPAALFKFWVNCLCISKIHQGFLPDLREISFRCRCSEKQASLWIAELLSRHLIDELPSGQLLPHDWSEHQYASDNVTARVRKHREKRSGNVSVTPSEQSRAEQSRDRDRAEAVSRAPLAADLNGQTSQRFEEFWSRYPRQQRKDFACREWLSRVSITAEGAVFACLSRYLASDEVSRGVVQNPDRWLYEQGRADWLGTWPARVAVQPEKRESKMQMLNRILPS